ncbi:MAG: uroporphyrinogen decarboxylase/cobalamine-independent methonine synthase family protein [Candidatus Humimicrobiaceae bacterium]
MSDLFNDTPHLIFQAHETQIDTELKIIDKDLKILRELGKKYAEIASLPVQDERINMWKRLNDLKEVKPLIWINEVCWNEMDINNELKINTSSIFCQRVETELRRTLYQWEHMQGDMVVEPIIYSPYIINNTGFGINPIADVREIDDESQIASRHFHNQIVSEEDIEKIKIPEITFDSKRTEEFYQAYESIFDGILKVKKRSSPGFWFAPWDDIVFWMGAENVLMNLAIRPDFMHKIINKLLDVYLAGLDQFEKFNLFALNNCNVRIGSGAYGYTDQLPQKDFNLNKIRTIDLWGSATPQIFGSVSPTMHKEFGLNYEIKWLSKFGLAYYGCCEPLHNKIEILAKIPNLRKISISPWANIDEASEKMRGKYVISLKPSPSVLAFETWEPELVKKELEKKLKAAKGCNVEIVLKDISTVKHQPWRLWEWVNIANEVTKNIYKG